MNSDKVNSIFKNFENTVFVVTPKHEECFLEGGDTEAETKFFRSIIKRAIDDLKYMWDINATKEQKNLAKSAFIWLFVERASYIKEQYNKPSSFREHRIYITSLDNICSWLNLNPSIFRESLAHYFGLPCAFMFVCKK